MRSYLVEGDRGKHFPAAGMMGNSCGWAMMDSLFVR